jgi:hypothetical protein
VLCAQFQDGGDRSGWLATGAQVAKQVHDGDLAA